MTSPVTEAARDEPGGAARSKPRWLRVVNALVFMPWLGCFYAWTGAALHLATGPDNAFVVGTIIGSTSWIGPLISRRRLAGLEAQRTALPAAHRHEVDEALRTGELRGGTNLQILERDLARARLEVHAGQLHGAPLIALRAVVLLAPFVAMLWCDHRPAWLVTVTVVDAVLLAGLFALNQARYSQQSEFVERATLRTLSRSRPR